MPPKTVLALLLVAGLVAGGCSSQQERALGYYDSGMKLFVANDKARAAIQLRNAVKLDKTLVPAWRGLQKIEEANRNWAGEIPILRAIVDLEPSDNKSRVLLTKLLFHAGALDEALTRVNEANEAEPGNAEILALRAGILFRQKDNAGAVRQAQEALKIDSENVNATIVLAADRLDAGDPKAALQVLDRASAAHADDFGLQLFRIKVLEQLQDLKQIEAVLHRFTELYPDEIQFRKELVRLYVFQNRKDDAEKEIRATIAAHPADTDLELQLIGFLYTAKGPTPAREEAVARIDAGGEVFPFRVALAEIDFAQGNIADSVRTIDGLIKEAKTPEQLLATKIKLAEMQLNRKNYEAAEAVVADILKGDSRNTAALRLRASIRLDRGQFDPAITDLRQALNDQPRSMDLMMLLAVAYERSGAIETAEKQYADATRASDFEPRIALAYVAFLQRRGSFERAEEVATELSTRAPNNVEVLSALAQMKLARRDWSAAQRIADAIQKIGNEQNLADQIRAAALGGQEKFDESIAILQTTYSAAPESLQPMVALVSAMMRAQRADQAEAVVQGVLRRDPDRAEAYVLLGAIAVQKNSPEEAVKSFTTAIEKQPKNIAGYRALANLYMAQKNDEEALKTLQAGIKEQPDSPELHLALAGVHEVTGNFEAAIAEYEHLLEREPSSLIIANNLASMLADHRSDKPSLERARLIAAGLRRSPIPQFKDTLGWVTYQDGDYKSAVPLLEDAATALPNRAVVNYHLAMGYIAMGQSAKAADRLKRALNQAPDKELEAKIRVALTKTGAE